MESIKLINTGLKCDNPTCEWEDETIKVEDYKDFINAPCPECGENILTQEDLDNMTKVHEVMNFVNSLDQETLDSMYATIAATPGGTKMIEDLESLGLGKDGIFSMEVNTHKELSLGVIKHIKNE
jgi:hypothetical protein